MTIGTVYRTSPLLINLASGEAWLLVSVRPKELFQFRPKSKFGFLKLPKPNRNRTFGYSAEIGISAEIDWFGRIFSQIFGRNRLVRQNIWLNMA